MKTVLHLAKDRGAGDYGWLTTRYSFSFSNYYDPAKMGFGALRVLNDDRIAPGAGFGRHSHSDMEIVTIILSGALTHTDSLGNTGTIGADEVQVMSAGAGIEHSEYNASKTQSVELFQLWIETNRPGVAPRYDQQAYTLLPSTFTPLVVPYNGIEGYHYSAPWIYQDAFVFMGDFRAGDTSQLPAQDGDGFYVLVIEGDFAVGDQILHARDAFGVSDADVVKFAALTDARVLLIVVPMASASL